MADSKAKEPTKKVKIPEGALSKDQALEFLGLPPEKKDDKDAWKSAYRKQAVKWHPDKNPDDSEYATEMFKAVNAAYHTLNTANFDFERWAREFVVPPMQSLEDVLLLALKGTDPMEIDAILRKRGDYRPPEQFGVDLNVPWSAGTKEKPSWEVGSADGYNTSQRLGYAQDSALALLTPGIDQSLKVGNSEDRPWETVGGLGFNQADSSRSTASQPPITKNTDVEVGSAEAVKAADAMNDIAVAAFKTKDWTRMYDAATEAVRLAPDKVPFKSNLSVAALKRATASADKGFTFDQRRFATEAAEQSTESYEIDPGHTKSWLRAAQAHVQLGKKEDVEQAIEEFKKVLELDPSNKAGKEGLKDAELTLMADYDSD